MPVLNLRSRRFVSDDSGYHVWQVVREKKEVPACRAAIVICDVWDRHWSRGATERLNAMVPRMNEVIKVAREKGVLIVHAPSDVVDFYADSPARRRVLAVPPADPPLNPPPDDPPVPVDASDGGSDTKRSSAARR